MTFTAMTEAAVREALLQPRSINENLVKAYLARLSMDFLLGYNLSPVLWKKLPGARSAGRVQSPALRLICDRETEQDLFKKAAYYGVQAQLSVDGSAQLVRVASWSLSFQQNT